MKGKFVVVCTDKRGVFSGFLKEQTQKTVTLTDCRMCVFWSSEVRGMPGLLNKGPIGESRVSPAAPESKINGVTFVGVCTDDARKVWESEPWK